jgi:hypothetical protein
MESLATPKVSVEHDYMFLLFSAGGLQHPLLTDLPLVAIPTDDYGMSVKNFLACRVTVITSEFPLSARQTLSDWLVMA